MRQFKNTKLVYERSIINKRKILEQDIRCQPMVVCTNSTLKGIPNLGCGEEGDFTQCKQLYCIQHSYGTAQQWYSSVMKQHGCGQAQLWGGPWVSWPLGEASLRQGTVPVCFALVWQDVFSLSAPARGKDSSVFGGKGKCVPWDRGELTHIERSSRIYLKLINGQDKLNC